MMYWAERTNLPPITEAQDPLSSQRKGNVFNAKTNKEFKNTQPVTIEVLIRPKFGHNAERNLNPKERIKPVRPTRSFTPKPKPGFTHERGTSLKNAQPPCERPKLRKTVSCIQHIKEEHGHLPATEHTNVVPRESSATFSKSTLTSSTGNSNESVNRIRTVRKAKWSNNNGSRKISLAQNEDVSQIVTSKRQTNEQFLDGKTKNRIIKWLSGVETARESKEAKTQNIENEIVQSINDSEQTLPMIDEENDISPTQQT
ncbi:uncharacterized protein LOC117111060 isoform X2 [Anneissia japonica]|nr:uncharacterized protein LOC117111060 isoform X2 [Anneissia japonica]